MGNKKVLISILIAGLLFIIFFTIKVLNSEKKVDSRNRDCLEMFRVNCISCHAIMNSNQNELITYREIFQLSSDSFQAIMQKAQEMHSHSKALSDSLKVFMNCKYSSVYE